MKIAHKNYGMAQICMATILNILMYLCSHLQVPQKIIFVLAGSYHHISVGTEASAFGLYAGTAASGQWRNRHINYRAPGDLCIGTVSCSVSEPSGAEMNR